MFRRKTKLGIPIDKYDDWMDKLVEYWLFKDDPLRSWRLRLGFIGRGKMGKGRKVTRDKRN